MITRLITLICRVSSIINEPPSTLFKVCGFSLGGIANPPNIYDIRDSKGYDKIHNATTSLLNDKEVQKELGVDVKNFLLCDMKIYAMMTDDIAVPQTLNLEYLIQNNYQVMLYFGDKDYICNWRGGEMLLAYLSWKGQTEFISAPTKNWMSGNETAGTYKKYQNLNFVTVKEAGHMVTMDQPKYGLSMLEKFIHNEF